MANPFEALISDNLLSTYQQGIDALINKLGKVCRLIYPPRGEDCPNCARNPIGNKSGNTYVHGGPIPFRKGTLCPMCGGEGVRFTSVTEEITLLVRFNPSDFENLGIPIETPNGTAQTKGYMTDLPKIRKAAEIILVIDIEPYVKHRYKKLGEAVPRGFKQKRYFIQNWERI